MSAISDVGVNFKMTGMDDFENRIKSLESKWNSMNETLNKSPQVNNHFQKMAGAAEKASERIVSVMNTAKAAVLAVMTAKAGAGAFEWAIGSKATADAKADLAQYIEDPNIMKAYEDAMARIRKEHNFAKSDLYKGAYQIDSALAEKPIEERIKAFELMAWYSKQTGKEFVEASKLYKQFLAAFGEQIPLDKQKTFAMDTLGMLYKIGQLTRSDPQQIADAASRSAQTYMQNKMSQARMFAEIASMTPRMGSAEIASTALRTIYPEIGGSAGKLAAKQYEEAFVRGQAWDKQGNKSRNWGSLRNLEVADAEGNEQAKKDLAELKQNMQRYEKDMKIEIQQMMNRGDIEGIWKRVGSLIEENKKNPTSAENLKDAFGLERLNAVLGLVDFYKQGTIQRLMQELENASGQAAIDSRAKADAQNLPHLWGLVTQGAEDLSASLRSVFYEPMKMLLEEWKAVFTKLEGDFAGEGGLQRIKSFSGSFMGGLRSGWNDGKELPEDNRSIGQIFQDFVAGLGAEDWKLAGQRIGQAASDFITVVGQFKEIVGSVHSFMSKFGIVKPLVAGGVTAALTPGPLPLKAATGGAVALNESGALEAVAKGPNIFEPRWTQIRESHGQQPTEKVAAPWMKAWQPLPADPVAMGFTPPGFGMGDVNVNLKTTVMVDGKELKSEIADEVVEKTIERIEGDMDRRRANATDWGHVGGY